MSDLNLVGVYRTGDHFMLVDANGNEYEVWDPQGLWQALGDITADPELPKAKLGSSIANKEIVLDACRQVEGLVSEEYGPLMGRVAGAAALTATRFMKKISR